MMDLISRRKISLTIPRWIATADRKSTRLNSSHSQISYAVFCLKKKIKISRRRTQAEFELEPTHDVEFGTTMGVLTVDRAFNNAGARLLIFNSAGAIVERPLIHF